MPHDNSLLDELEARAIAEADGHFTIMRFTTNWRVGLGTPGEREDIARMAVGKTLAEAINNRLAQEPYDGPAVEADQDELDRLLAAYPELDNLETKPRRK